MNKTMNKTKLPILLAMLLFAAGFCLVQPSLNAQQDRPTAQQPDQAEQPQAAQPQTSMSQMSDAQTFTGRIAKAGGKYVLRDSTNKATYMLDDQDKAKQFEGQAVQVTGALDAQTKTIRISSITPGS